MILTRTIKLLKLEEALNIELKTLILLTKDICDAFWDVVDWTPDLVGVTVLCCKKYGQGTTLTVFLFTQIYKWVLVE